MERFFGRVGYVILGLIAGWTGIQFIFRVFQVLFEEPDLLGEYGFLIWIGMILLCILLFYGSYSAFKAAVGLNSEDKLRIAKKQAAQKQLHVDFGRWLNEVGIDLECGRCLSRHFDIISYSNPGLSFYAKCKACNTREWFKVHALRKPFDFHAYRGAYGKGALSGTLFEFYSDSSSNYS